MGTIHALPNLYDNNIVFIVLYVYLYKYIYNIYKYILTWQNIKETDWDIDVI